jgi:ketosteroid isomerase-like protein
MTARNPEDLDVLFARELNAGKLDGLVALSETGATFTVEPGKVVAGTSAIREALGGYLAMKPLISLKTRILGNTGDVVMMTSTWQLTGTGPDGAAVDLKGDSAEIARRQPDGSWKFIIDSPWGAGLIPAGG